MEEQIDENEALNREQIEDAADETAEAPETPEQPKEEKPKKKKEKVSVAHRIMTVVGIVLCVILIPILISNIVLIIQSYTNKDEVPSLFSVSPMIVMTDSMEPTINGGDLIFIKKVEAKEIKEETIIAFFDPASTGSSIVTHRVKQIVTDEEGNISFYTMGDANGGVMDRLPVRAEKVVGVYMFRLRGLGSVAMFMQTVPGLILCVVVPLFLLIGYDVIRRYFYNKQKQAETDELLAELEALKAEKAGANTTSAETVDEADTKSEAVEQTNDENIH